ncbi:MAG: Crp/Fnr family transcriptional regulator [Bacteroidales bacterium]|nr:Crp/Fnr family transcriptional regulator [Bacteroidales bacterium]
MKFSKGVKCLDCNLKCDIYKAVIECGADLDEVKPLHVIYKKHENISKQGRPVSHAIYVVDGSAKLYIEGLNNRNIILYILKPQSYIGLLSFFESPFYSYSVSALEETQICMIDLDFIKKLYLQNHDFLIRLNKAFGKSVSSIMNKIITLNQKNIRGRVAESLLYLSSLNNSEKFSIFLTRKELGELSAISEENTVRLLTEFRREGIIDLNGKELHILDKKLLQKISEVG